MNPTKVSVIIPVYNVEEYLRQCLDSIVNQTLKEIEIICVNDGSTDNSHQILTEYAQKDKRIIIINKENEGLGAARNTGMAYATGEYIGFVDSDDWVKLEAYEKFYKNAKTQNSDMVMCPIHVYDDITGKLKYDNPYFTLECLNEEFDNCIFNHLKTKNFLFKISVTSPNKIYKREFLNEINAKFPERLIFEDNPFFYETYLKARNVSLIRDFLYFYRINRKDSIILKSDKSYFDLIKIHELCKQIFVETGNFDQYKVDLLDYTINNLFYRCTQINEIYKEEFFELIKQKFEKMNLKVDEISELNTSSKSKYQNIINASSYKELELLETINQLKHQNKIYEDQLRSQIQIVQKITSSHSWKITKPLRTIGVGLRKIKNVK